MFGAFSTIGKMEFKAKIKNRKHCPLCGRKRTFWRNGAHFDHQLRCGHCHFCFDPSHFGEDAILALNRLHAKLDAEIESPKYDQITQALSRFGIESCVVAGRDSEPALRIENVEEFLRFLDTRIK